MQRFAVIGAAVLVLGIAFWTTGVRVEAGEAKGPTPSERLVLLEHKMANLEKIVGVRLDDDTAIGHLISQQQEAMAKAEASSVVAVLMTIRSQLELYNVQHNGQYPDLARGWDQLVNGTDTAGRVFRSGETGRGVMGPYLNSPAINPFTGSSKVVADPNTIGEGVGWLYVKKTGEFKAVVPKSVAEVCRFSSVDVVVY